MNIIKFFLEPFMGKGIGEKFPLIRDLFYNQFSRIMVRIKSPITISGGYKLHLPPNGIDYLMGEYERLETELIEKNLKEGDTFLDIGGGGLVITR